MKKIKELELVDMMVFPNETIPVTPVRWKEGYELHVQKVVDDGIFLPSWEQLIEKDWGVDSLRTTDGDFEIILSLKINGYCYRLYTKFDRRWITDLASVPRVFRSVVDNDAQWILAASQVHDALFVLRGAGIFDFKATNKIFYEMCKFDAKKQGIGKIKPWLAYAAVSTPFGKKRWNVKRENWEKQGVTFELERAE